MEKDVWKAFKMHIDKTYSYLETEVGTEREMLERKLFIHGHVTVNDPSGDWWKQIKRKYFKLINRERKD